MSSTASKLENNKIEKLAPSFQESAMREQSGAGRKLGWPRIFYDGFWGAIKVIQPFSGDHEIILQGFFDGS